MSTTGAGGRKGTGVASLDQFAEPPSYVRLATDLQTCLSGLATVTRIPVQSKLRRNLKSK